MENNGVNDANLWLSSTVERGYRVEMQRRIIICACTSRFCCCSFIMLSSTSAALLTSLRHGLIDICLPSLRRSIYIPFGGTRTRQKLSSTELDIGDDLVRLHTAGASGGGETLARA